MFIFLTPILQDLAGKIRTFRTELESVLINTTFQDPAPWRPMMAAAFYPAAVAPDLVEIHIALCPIIEFFLSSESYRAVVTIQTAWGEEPTSFSGSFHSENNARLLYVEPILDRRALVRICVTHIRNHLVFTLFKTGERVRECQ